MIEAPPLLYKYLHADRIDVLEHSLVRFSQPKALNDPFELVFLFDETGLRTQMDRIFGSAYAEKFSDQALDARFDEEAASVLKDPDLNEKLALLPRNLRRQARRGFSRAVRSKSSELKNAVRAQGARAMLEYADVISQETESIINEVVERSVLFCASACPVSVPMWAHYSGNHTGLQIGFDPHEMFATLDNRMRPQPVEYVDSIPVFGADFDRSSFFLMKMRDWSYEQEWRFLYPISRPSPIQEAEVILYPFSPSAIKEITFGLKAPATLVERVAAMKKQYDRARLLRCVNFSEQYKMGRQPID